MFIGEVKDRFVTAILLYNDTSANGKVRSELTQSVSMTTKQFDLTVSSICTFEEPKTSMVCCIHDTPENEEEGALGCDCCVL